jgi:hypothetical protein
MWDNGHLWAVDYTAKVKAGYISRTALTRRGTGWVRDYMLMAA